MTSLYAPGTDPEAGRTRSRWEKTPAHLLTPQAQGVPDDPVALPSTAWTPCAVCGQAAPTPTGTNGRARVDLTTDVSGAVSAVRLVTFSLTRCDDCQVVHHRALAIVEAHSGLAAALGPDLARERVEDVLVALGLLGRPLLGPEAARPELELHLRHLHQTGSSLTWRSRAVVGLCNPYPWAHARLSERRRLREAYAVLLRERVALTAPPVKVLPPEPSQSVWSRGCLFCGVGHLALPATQVQHLGGRAAASRSLWTSCLTSTDALGGRPSPVLVDGHLCPRCNDALVSEGAVGPTSLSRAMLDRLAASGDPATREKAERLRDTMALDADLNLRPVGWGALAARDQGRKPNTDPWGHLDLG